MRALLLVAVLGMAGSSLAAQDLTPKDSALARRLQRRVILNVAIRAALRADSVNTTKTGSPFVLLERDASGNVHVLGHYPTRATLNAAARGPHSVVSEGGFSPSAPGAHPVQYLLIEYTKHAPKPPPGHLTTR